MQKRANLTLTTFAVGIVGMLATSTSTASGPRADTGGRAAALQAVDALDRCIQDRFSRTDKGFGLSRMSVAVHNIRHFIPTTGPEERAVRTFDRLGLRAVMYLVSRQQPRFGRWGVGSIPPLVQGPVFVSPTPRLLVSSPAGAPVDVEVDPRMLTELPSNADVTTEANRIGTFAGGESRQFDVGRWAFVARAIRASDERCLTCHNWRPPDERAGSTASGAPGESFRVGDPLGAVLYAFQPSSKRP